MGVILTHPKKSDGEYLQIIDEKYEWIKTDSIVFWCSFGGFFLFFFYIDCISFDNRKLT